MPNKENKLPILAYFAKASLGNKSSMSVTSLWFARTLTCEKTSLLSIEGSDAEVAEGSAATARYHRTSLPYFCPCHLSVSSNHSHVRLW